MDVLELDGVTKDFGSIRAVDDASFTVEDGEFVSVLGPSGSGKSTILRMIAGFEDPTSGSISMGDVDLVGRPPFERDVNMVFQGLALFPHLTVAENIAYGLKQQGIPKQEREDLIAEMLEMVDLAGYGNRNPEELSGGEQQRVALARALVNKPEVVLFDEPLASLDRKLRQHMQVELQRIQSETDITFLYVTHDQEVALSVSDRLILLNEGEIEQMGSVEELYDYPSSPFVADFIGDVNHLQCTVEETTPEEVTVSIGEESIIFTDSTVRNLIGAKGAGESMSICVRPHSLEIADRPFEDRPSIQGRVTNRMYMGNEITYIVDSNAGELTVTTNQDEYEMGTRVNVSWLPENAHIFHDGDRVDNSTESKEVTA